MNSKSDLTPEARELLLESVRELGTAINSGNKDTHVVEANGMTIRCSGIPAMKEAMVLLRQLADPGTLPLNPGARMGTNSPTGLVKPEVTSDAEPVSEKPVVKEPVAEAPEVSPVKPPKPAAHKKPKKPKHRRYEHVKGRKADDVLNRRRNKGCSPKERKMYAAIYEECHRLSGWMVLHHILNRAGNRVYDEVARDWFVDTKKVTDNVRTFGQYVGTITRACEKLGYDKHDVIQPGRERNTYVINPRFVRYFRDYVAEKV